MKNRKKLDILIKELLDNEISFTIEPDANIYECYAGYNQRNLEEVLKRNDISYKYLNGRYWWDI